MKILARISVGIRDTGVSFQVLVSILEEGVLVGFSHKSFVTAAGGSPIDRDLARRSRYLAAPCSIPSMSFHRNLSD